MNIHYWRKRMIAYILRSFKSEPFLCNYLTPGQYEAIMSYKNSIFQQKMIQFIANVVNYTSKPTT